MAGLNYSAQYGVDERYQFDIFSSPFEEHFDVVAMFDVLEHFENETGALSNVYRMLAPKGKLVLTVPAHSWLWSANDLKAAHKRRYSVQRIEQVLTATGFTVLERKCFLCPFCRCSFCEKCCNRHDTIWEKGKFQVHQMR